MAQRSPDADDVARQLVGCESGHRAQGLFDTPGDRRLYVAQLKDTAEQIDLQAGGDPAWRIVKNRVDAVYADYKDIGWFDIDKLSTEAGNRLEELNKTLQEWAERLRKAGRDVAPLAIKPPQSSYDDAKAGLKAAQDLITGVPGGPTLGDRVLPSVSNGVKWIAGIGLGYLVLRELRPYLDRFGRPRQQPAEQAIK